jgi:hypothetical protein
MTPTNGDGEHGPDDPEFAIGGGPRDWAAGGEPADEVDEVDEVDDEGGFVPPDPGPVLGGDPLLTMAWAGVIAVPIVLVASTVLNYAVPTWLFIAIGAVFVVGVGVLVWRLPSHGPTDGDGNGAVV